jgi:23S rRNA (uracil1939-C5)-methyltransferase
LRALFTPWWNAPIPVEPSPVVWHYRNKVDFAFGRKWYPEPPPPGFVRESVLGFKTRGQWYRPLDVRACRIGPDGLAPLLEAVRAWMRAQRLSAFDSRRREGFLRVLLVREGTRTGERMVVLITTPGEFDPASFVETVHSSYPCVSIQRGVFRGLADVAAAEEVELLYGKGAIEEVLHVPGADGPRALRFRISPFSFFQTNTLATERLYTAIRQWVEDRGPRVLYDLYGGAGGIAFTCADLVETVHSVESVALASEDGVHNAALNEIGNVRFVTDTVEGYLRQIRDHGSFERDSAVVLDPPRSGLHPKALRRLIELRPAQLLYVSCKPTVLATELPAFLEAYRLADLRAVDLFPHTEHVEVLASLEANRE